MLVLAVLAALAALSSAQIFCPPGWMDIAGTCVLIKCDKGYFYRIAHGQCEWIDPCYSIEYQVVEPTHTTNRICKVYTKCCDFEFEVVAPTRTSDRMCDGMACTPVLIDSTSAGSVLPDTSDLLQLTSRGVFYDGNWLTMAGVSFTIRPELTDMSWTLWSVPRQLFYAFTDRLYLPRIAPWGATTSTTMTLTLHKT